MTKGISTLSAAAACLIVACLLVRLAGQFAVGHAFRANRWLRDRSR